MPKPAGDIVLADAKAKFAIDDVVYDRKDPVGHVGTIVELDARAAKVRWHATYSSYVSYLLLEFAPAHCNEGEQLKPVGG